VHISKEEKMTQLSVQDLMTEKVFSVREHEDLASVYDLMMENHIRHIPVINIDGDVVGLVSHRDLMGNALASDQTLPIAEFEDLLRSIKVREVMQHGIQTIEAQDSAEEAGRIMLENKFGCLPVVEGDKLIGIVTESDFVRFVIESSGNARGKVA